MTSEEYENLLEKVCQKTGFVREKEVYRGDYYRKEKIKNIIFSGTYKNKPAILKLYDDERTTDEPLSLRSFNEANKSQFLRAPELYEYGIVSGSSGWLIEERLPERSNNFNSPLDGKTRKEFLRAYLEYRKNFPKAPHRNLDLAEHLRADEFHSYRINRWLEMANIAERQRSLEGKQAVLDPETFLPKYRDGLEMIKKEFIKRKMFWCHGHFKPHEVFRTPEGEYCLIDFAHTKMYPEGYELAFIVWADWLMGAGWKMEYGQWKEGISAWAEEIKKINKELKLEDIDSLFRASLVERCLGTILADVTASDKPEEEKTARVKLLYLLLDDLINCINI